MARPFRSARVLALVAGSLATALVACSLLNGLDADYTLRPPGEGGKDGDVDPEGGGADARNDNDVVGDGGVDATTDARFCDLYADAANVVYCCDFETPASGPTFDWDDFESTSGSSNVEEGVGANKSRGLHAIVNKPPSSGRVLLRKQIPGPFNAVVKHELSFAFSVRTKSSLYTASLGALGFGPAPFKVMGVSVYKALPMDNIDVGDPPRTVPGAVETVNPGEWRRATITMERVGTAPYTTTIAVTSKAGAVTQVDQRPGFDGGTAPTEILVGAFFTSNDPDGGVETVIDDVLLKQTK